jgi:four helix bundle protein
METSRISRYGGLDVWLLSIDLADTVCALGEKLPKSEHHGLTSQVQSAAVAVPTNIAAGHARKTSEEFLAFISNAFDSLEELEKHFHIIDRLKYLDAAETKSIFEKIDKVGQMLREIQQKIKDKN